jgi:hypothetical protein
MGRLSCSIRRRTVEGSRGQAGRGKQSSNVYKRGMRKSLSSYLSLATSHSTSHSSLSSSLQGNQYEARGLPLPVGRIVNCRGGDAAYAIRRILASKHDQARCIRIQFRAIKTCNRVANPSSSRERVHKDGKLRTKSMHYRF